MGPKIKALADKFESSPRMKSVADARRTLVDFKLSWALRASDDDLVKMIKATQVIIRFYSHLRLVMFRSGLECIVHKVECRELRFNLKELDAERKFRLGELKARVKLLS